jgi:heme exporter protein C
VSESTYQRLSLALLGATLLLLLVAFYQVFFVVPTEKTMGTVQRIFYIHLPSATVAFNLFFVVFVCSIGYLRTRRPGWDRVAVSAAEVGVIFCAAVLVTGPLWAKPVWGIWWTWDPRLTTTLILFLIFVGYLMLRVYVEDRTAAPCSPPWWASSGLWTCPSFTSPTASAASTPSR